MKKSGAHEGEGKVKFGRKKLWGEKRGMDHTIQSGELKQMYGGKKGAIEVQQVKQVEGMIITKRGWRLGGGKGRIKISKTNGN